MLSTLRSYLYVPGDQPAKLARAMTRGADALIVDLEDGVAPEAKPQARRSLARWLNERTKAMASDQTAGPDQMAGAHRADPEIWVRVNAPGSEGLPPAEDLRAAVHPALAGIVVAKCDSTGALSQLDRFLTEAEHDAGIKAGSVAVAALVETAAGLLALRDLAGAARIVRLQIGEADLVASLGMAPGPDSTELMPLRLALVVASAAAGISPPIGPVYTHLGDLEGLRRSTDALRRLGFAGRAAVHPSQIPIINQVFTPSSEQVVAALDVLGRFDTARQQAAGVALAADGALIDEAVVRNARAVIERQRRYGSFPPGAPAPPQGSDRQSGL